MPTTTAPVYLLLSQLKPEHTPKLHGYSEDTRRQAPACSTPLGITHTALDHRNGRSVGRAGIVGLRLLLGIAAEVT